MQIGNCTTMMGIWRRIKWDKRIHMKDFRGFLVTALTVSAQVRRQILHCLSSILCWSERMFSIVFQPKHRVMAFHPVSLHTTKETLHLPRLFPSPVSLVKAPHCQDQYS